MQGFKTFIGKKIAYFVSHFKKRAMLLNFDGTPLTQIDLSFDTLFDEYQQLENADVENQTQTVELKKTSGSMIRINDHDLQPFLENLDDQWTGSFDIADQDITDQTILRLVALLKDNKCKFMSLNFKNNKRITFIGGMALGDALRSNNLIRRLILHNITLQRQGANRIIELISLNKTIKEYDFGNIGNDSMVYLAKHLENPHSVEHLAFGQNEKKKWQEDGKRAFDQALRKNSCSKYINSITVYPEHPEEHYSFIAELSIICSKNRTLRIKQRQNDYKSKSLNPEHPKYYDPDNHALNAYKFSVKSYLTNVFGSMLDEGLYFLEKERRNSLREQAIFNITKNPINKTILEDICTSDGSIMVLTQYLLKKIKPGKQ